MFPRKNFKARGSLSSLGWRRRGEVHQAHLLLSLMIIFRKFDNNFVSDVFSCWCRDGD